MIKVLFVCDQALIKQCLRAIFHGEKGLSLLHAPSIKEAISIAKTRRPDIVLLYITPPSIHYLEIIAKISKERRVVVLTDYSMVFFPKLMFQSGVMGCVSLQSGLSSLFNAIHKCMENERYIEPATATRMALETLSPSEKQNPISLISARELEVLVMKALGQSDEEIAKSLCLDEKTVQSHRYALFNKFSAEKDVDLFFKAMEYKLVDLSHF